MTKKIIVIFGFAKTGFFFSKIFKLNEIIFFFADDNNYIINKKKIVSFSNSFFFFTFFIKKIYFIVVSPGINLSNYLINLFFILKVPILSDLEFVNWFYKNLFFICVTGTNGKTTTSIFINNIFIYFKKFSFLSGNIGNPISKIFLKNFFYDFILLELSSYQIEIIYYIKFLFFFLTNLSCDHLERYCNLNVYYFYKKIVFNFVLSEGCSFYNLKDNILFFLSNSFIFFINFKFRMFFFFKNFFLLKYFNNFFTYKLFCYSLKRNYFNFIIIFFFISFLNLKKYFYIFLKFKNAKYRINMKKNFFFFLINDSKSTNFNSLFYLLNFSFNQIYLIIGGVFKVYDNFFFLLKFIFWRKINLFLIYNNSLFMFNFFNFFKTKVFFLRNLSFFFLFLVNFLYFRPKIFFSPSSSSLGIFRNYINRAKVFNFYFKIFCNFIIEK